MLIVDDNSLIRQAVQVAAQAAGFTVTQAENGQQAVEFARRHQPDSVVLDVQMPVLDGLSALPLIREAAPRATVVILSAAGGSGLREAAVSLGAAAVFRKGVDPIDKLIAFLNG